MDLFPLPLFNEIFTSKKREFNIFFIVCVFPYLLFYLVWFTAEMEPRALLVRQGLYHCATVLGRGNNLSGASVTLILTIYSSIMKLGPIITFYIFLFFFYWKWSFFHKICSDYVFPSLSSSEIIITFLRESLSWNFLTISKHFLTVCFFSGCFSLPWVKRFLPFVFVLFFSKWNNGFHCAVSPVLFTRVCQHYHALPPLLLPSAYVCVCDFTCMLKYETCV